MANEQCGEQNAALKSRAFAPRTAAEARRAEVVVAKRLAQRFVLGVKRTKTAAYLHQGSPHGLMDQVGRMGNAKFNKPA